MIPRTPELSLQAGDNEISPVPVDDNNYRKLPVETRQTGGSFGEQVKETIFGKNSAVITPADKLAARDLQKEAYRVEIHTKFNTSILKMCKSNQSKSDQQAPEEDDPRSEDGDCKNGFDTCCRYFMKYSLTFWATICGYWFCHSFSNLYEDQNPKVIMAALKILACCIFSLTLWAAFQLNNCRQWWCCTKMGCQWFFCRQLCHMCGHRGCCIDSDTSTLPNGSYFEIEIHNYLNQKIKLENYGESTELVTVKSTEGTEGKVLGLKEHDILIERVGEGRQEHFRRKLTSWYARKASVEEFNAKARKEADKLLLLGVENVEIQQESLRDRGYSETPTHIEDTYHVLCLRPGKYPCGFHHWCNRSRDVLLHWFLAAVILFLMILNGLDNEYKVAFPGQEVFVIVAVSLVGTAGLMMTYFQHYFVVIFKGEEPTSCQVCKHRPLTLPDDDKRQWEIWEWTYTGLQITNCESSTESRKIYENKLRHAAFIMGTKVHNKNFLTDTLEKFHRYNLFAENCQQFAHAIFRKAQRKEYAYCWRGFTWLFSFVLANSFGIPITTMFVLIDISHYNDQASVDGAHVYLAAHIFVMLFVTLWFLGSHRSLHAAGQGGLLGVWIIFIGIFCIYSYCDAHKEDACDLWDKDGGIRGFICIGALFFFAAIGTIIISTPSCLAKLNEKDHATQ